ncbi:MAG: HupE/UreJ family protein [Acidobacteriia bacterium]|nr:HupE/UreJ family protein [Terriglobia bacterium]
MKLGWFFLAVWPAAAHVMSMSSGDLTVDGTHAHYELRMPLYEVAHITNPDHSIFDNIHFASGLRQARPLTEQCRTDNASNTYVCAADYEFANPPDAIDVNCRFASITVPNHVHLLRAAMGGKRDQAVLDLSFPKATLRFRPPTPLETVVTETGAGFIRAWGGMVQILFLAALVLAGRSLKEMAALSGMFLAGQAVSVLVLSHSAWQPAARFAEAAAALTIAYLAMEILLLPQAGARWMIAAILGAFHGLYFDLLLRETNYNALYVLGGADLAELIAIAGIWALLSQIKRVAHVLRPVQVSASALLAFGMVWFFLRLRS